MRIVARIINPGVALHTSHELTIFRKDFDEVFVEAAAQADLVMIRSLPDYELIQHLPVKKCFRIVTDDPSAALWKTMDRIYANPTVRAVLADTPQVLWHWRVPDRLGWVAPKGLTFERTHDWSPTKAAFVAVISDVSKRGWHVGQDQLEWFARRFPVDLIGTNNGDVANVNWIGPVDHNDLSKVISQYHGALMPFRYSASPNWLGEAMLQGMPIVSFNFDYARIYVPGAIGWDDVTLLDRARLTLTNPTSCKTYRDRGLFEFSPYRGAKILDAILDAVV